MAITTIACSMHYGYLVRCGRGRTAKPPPASEPDFAAIKDSWPQVARTWGKKQIKLLLAARCHRLAHDDFMAGHPRGPDWRWKRPDTNDNPPARTFTGACTGSFRAFSEVP